ncbi:hypothetical protein HN51_071205 [Arachis hypogaea]
MTKACKVFDQFLYSCIATKHQELNGCNKSSGDDLLSAMMVMGEEKGKMVHDDKFLRDAAFNLFVAGRDTITSALTWFFWLVATHPLVEAKILEEIEKVNDAGVKKKRKIVGMEDVKKLVYLHGALCEGLRLFPPVPIKRKQSLKRDTTLPSGHCVNPNTIILLFTCAMGRFEVIWGKDCLEFKPDRDGFQRKEKQYMFHLISFLVLTQVQGHAWEKTYLLFK